MITLSSGSLVVHLRSPDFGNKDSLEVRRINRKTRGGELIVFRDPAWPKNRNVELKFSFLKQSDLPRLSDFVQRTLGQTVAFTDHNGRSWTGIITSPNIEVGQEGTEDYVATVTIQIQL